MLPDNKVEVLLKLMMFAFVVPATDVLAVKLTTGEAATVTTAEDVA